MADGTSGAQAYAAQLEYQHATDEWRFHGGGSRFMTVINSNVGIGDTSPSEKLSVTGNIKASGNITGSANALLEGGLLRLGKASNADGRIILHNNTGTATFTIQNEDGNGIFQASSDSNRILTFSNAGSGNLGIEVEGNISGSAVSTGSFGSLQVDGAAIDFTNVPTSDPGIAGRVWRDGTDLKISTG